MNLRVTKREFTQPTTKRKSKPNSGSTLSAFPLTLDEFLRQHSAIVSTDIDFDLGAFLQLITSSSSFSSSSTTSGGTESALLHSSEHIRDWAVSPAGDLFVVITGTGNKESDLNAVFLWNRRVSSWSIVNVPSCKGSSRAFFTFSITNGVELHLLSWWSEPDFGTFKLLDSICSTNEGQKKVAKWEKDIPISQGGGIIPALDSDGQILAVGVNDPSEGSHYIEFWTKKSTSSVTVNLPTAIKSNIVTLTWTKDGLFVVILFSSGEIVIVRRLGGIIATNNENHLQLSSDTIKSIFTETGITFSIREKKSFLDILIKSEDPCEILASLQSEALSSKTNPTEKAESILSVWRGIVALPCTVSITSIKSIFPSATLFGNSRNDPSGRLLEFFCLAMKRASELHQWANDVCVTTYFITHVAVILFQIAMNHAGNGNSPCDSEEALRCAFSILSIAEMSYEKLRASDENIPAAQFGAQWLELLSVVRKIEHVLEIATEQQSNDTGEKARALLSSLMGTELNSITEETHTPEEFVNMGHMSYIQGSIDKAASFYEKAGNIGALPLLLLNLEKCNIKQALQVTEKCRQDAGIVSMMALFMASYFLSKDHIFTFSSPFSDKLRVLLQNLSRSGIPSLPPDIPCVPVQKSKIDELTTSIEGWSASKAAIFSAASGFIDLSSILYSIDNQWQDAISVCVIRSGKIDCILNASRRELEKALSNESLRYRIPQILCLVEQISSRDSSTMLLSALKTLLAESVNFISKLEIVVPESRKMGQSAFPILIATFISDPTCIESLISERLLLALSLCCRFYGETTQQILMGKTIDNKSPLDESLIDLIKLIWFLRVRDMTSFLARKNSSDNIPTVWAAHYLAFRDLKSMKSLQELFLEVIKRFSIDNECIDVFARNVTDENSISANLRSEFESVFNENREFASFLESRRTFYKSSTKKVIVSINDSVYAEFLGSLGGFTVAEKLFEKPRRLKNKINTSLPSENGLLLDEWTFSISAISPQTSPSVGSKSEKSQPNHHHNHHGHHKKRPIRQHQHKKPPQTKEKVHKTISSMPPLQIPMKRGSLETEVTASEMAAPANRQQSSRESFEVHIANPVLIGETSGNSTPYNSCPATPIGSPTRSPSRASEVSPKGSEGNSTRETSLLAEQQQQQQIIIQSQKNTKVAVVPIETFSRLAIPLESPLMEVSSSPSSTPSIPDDQQERTLQQEESNIHTLESDDENTEHPSLQQQEENRINQPKLQPEFTGSGDTQGVPLEIDDSSEEGTTLLEQPRNIGEETSGNEIITSSSSPPSEDISTSSPSENEIIEEEPEQKEIEKQQQLENGKKAKEKKKIDDRGVNETEQNVSENVVQESEMSLITQDQKSKEVQPAEVIKEKSSSEGEEQIEQRENVTEGKEQELSEELKKWLTEISEDFRQYFHVFASEGFKSVGDVLALNEEDLISLGIKMAHRKLMLSEISTHLNENQKQSEELRMPQFLELTHQDYQHSTAIQDKSQQPLNLPIPPTVPILQTTSSTPQQLHFTLEPIEEENKPTLRLETLPPSLNQRRTTAHPEFLRLSEQSNPSLTLPSWTRDRATFYQVNNNQYQFRVETDGKTLTERVLLARKAALKRALRLAGDTNYSNQTRLPPSTSTNIPTLSIEEEQEEITLQRINETKKRIDRISARLKSIKEICSSPPDQK